MACDFTVISAVRQRFGDTTRDGSEVPVEGEAPFVGPSKDFPFSCPDVAPGEMAVLQFETVGVSVVSATSPRGIIRINGVDIPGGITPGPRQGDLPLWKSHTLLIEANVLRPDNVLHIESIMLRPLREEATLDNFIIDNIVVFYKTRTRVIRPTLEGEFGVIPSLPEP